MDARKIEDRIEEISVEVENLSDVLFSRGCRQSKALLKLEIARLMAEGQDCLNQLLKSPLGD